MTASLQLPAPAKLNLMLHITGRRADGYHLLETVFQFVDLCDRLEISVGDPGRIERRGGATSVAPDEDLAIRAARLLQSRYQPEAGAIIAIDKRIPLGGGLGGGSSDAATSLIGLNQLWSLGLSLDELAAVGLELGADVPVFVRGRAAWATGVGELLQPVDLPTPYYLVIDPGTPVSTASVFNARELTRHCDPLTIRAFLRGAGGNVCEPVVRQLYSEVADALDWLGQSADARMSGTGGSVFAAFDGLEAAEALKSRVPERWRAYVVRGLNQSPLHRQLGLSDETE